MRLDESDEALELDPVALSPVLMPDAQDDDHMVTDTPVADGAGNTVCAGNPPSARSARSVRSVRSVRSAHSGDASGHSEEETVAAKVAVSVPQGGCDVNPRPYLFVSSFSVSKTCVRGDIRRHSLLKHPKPFQIEPVILVTLCGGSCVAAHSGRRHPSPRTAAFILEKKGLHW